MFAWLKSLFRQPVPAGEPQEIRAYSTGDATISRDCVTPDAEGGWKIAVEYKQSVRLFELPVRDTDSCMLVYRARMKSEGLAGKAYIEMWCRFPGRGEFFSKGLNSAISGNTGWVTAEAPFYLKPGEKPDLLKLNVHVEGKGTVHVRDFKVLKTPLNWS